MSEQDIGPWATQRLVIRKGRAGDADEIWPWREDDEINQWLTSIPTSPEQNKDRWVAGLDSNYVAEIAGTIVATGKIAPEQAWAQAEVADQAKAHRLRSGGSWHRTTRARGSARSSPRRCWASRLPRGLVG